MGGFIGLLMSIFLFSGVAVYAETMLECEARGVRADICQNAETQRLNQLKISRTDISPIQDDVSDVRGQIQALQVKFEALLLMFRQILTLLATQR